MKLDYLFDSTSVKIEYSLIQQRCSQFLEESRGLPLLKNLSSDYGDFHKIKVRKRNLKDDFTETFNEAFESELPYIRQRAVFANGSLSFEPTNDNNLEPFYVFPVDGYKFMYSKEVENSNHEYKRVFDTIFEQFGDEKGNEVLTDLLRFTYTTENLYEGIHAGCEIILYGIPFFYAMKTSTIQRYQDFYNRIVQDGV